MSAWYQRVSNVCNGSKADTRLMAALGGKQTLAPARIKGDHCTRLLPSALSGIGRMLLRLLYRLRSSHLAMWRAHHRLATLQVQKADIATRTIHKDCVVLGMHQSCARGPRVCFSYACGHDPLAVDRQPKGDRDANLSLCDAGASAVINHEELHDVWLVRVDLGANAVAKTPAARRIPTVSERDVGPGFPLVPDYPTLKPNSARYYPRPRRDRQRIFGVCSVVGAALPVPAGLPKRWRIGRSDP